MEHYPHTGKQVIQVIRINSFLLLLFFVFGTIGMNAQTPQETFYKKENSRNRKAPAYVSEREADVMWSKRVWRTIDVREKFNHPIYYPETPTNDRRSLFDVIKDGILSGEISAFDNPAFDDEFKVRMTRTQINDLFYSWDYTTKVEDAENPGKFISVPLVTPLESHDVMQYWMKEDWFFDKKRSVMDVRILGMCPLKSKYDPVTGAVIGVTPLFWIYFPQCRAIFAKAEVYNTKNDAQRMSFDDLFEQRMFGSYIRKESNVVDRVGTAYTDSQALGIETLLEADRIKDDIFKTEHDVWQF
jgi:gliding motility associated protien GldN